MKEQLDLRCVMQRNAAEIKRLQDRVHGNYSSSSGEPDGLEAWKTACREFHDRYDELAFPGGLSAGYERIEKGEPEAIDSALAFLEIRPYFFRSQYIQTKLLRLLKHTTLSTRQAERWQKILRDRDERQKIRKLK